MSSQWNPYSYYSTRNAPMPQDTQHLIQIAISLDSRLDKLIKLMEENNQLLRSIEQQQNRVVTAGGGSVIVRM
ncbi:hypothetical protein [Paenibacillus contaminans]|uniref:YkzH n=1 Tax=Paenibacillus contaminans TaxID=450362 RepID=A0A329MAJ3_9BACL|nr:hypothetical protein [Paenibacillus contaminans]RAV16712.1 hypothetical protein DQG23_28155 [Paenibacillus contaminans]